MAYGDASSIQRAHQTAALFASLALLAGCTEPPGTSDEAATEPPVTAPAITHRVTVTEGTNLAFDLSPDGKTIALSIQGVLFTMPAAGGVATAITDYYQDVREPAFTPDGKSIVYYGYSAGNWDLFSIPADGGSPEALTSDPFDDREPRVAPDGTHIAFSSDRSGNYDIWTLRLADGVLTRMTNSPANEYGPDWNGDGSQLTFVSAADRRSSAIHIIDVAGGTSALVKTETGAVNGVHFVPDTGELAYQVAVPGHTALKTVKLDGTDGETISEAGDDVFPFRARWQAGTALYAANGKIWRDTGAERQAIPMEATFELTRTPWERKRRDHDNGDERQVLGLSQPALSPDAETVAFAALGDIWLWQPATGSLTNLTESPFAARSPRWAPGGERIAYVSDRPAATDAVPAPGLWIHSLRDGTTRPVPVAGNGASNPSWSPDGESIGLFVSAPSPTAGQLVVVNLRDGNTTPIGDPIPAQQISWSQDGSAIATTRLAPYSSRFREGVYHLVVRSLEGGDSHEIEPVAHRTMTNAVLTPTGQAMSFVQDGRLWRQALDETFVPQGDPVALTDGLADAPSWSRDGRFIVYMDADRMMRLDTRTGEAVDITPPLTWQPDQPEGTWTLLVGRLFDGTSEGYVENALLTIDGNRISSIEPGSAGVAADVDASDKAAFPGLFEMHAHMGEVSESQGRAWLAYGVTSVRDPGAEPYVAKERQEMWSSGDRIGPRTYTTGFLTDGNRVYYSVAEGITSDAHLERALDRAERLELDFIKTYVRLPDRWQRRVVEFAHGIGIPTSSHELFPAVAHGMDHVEHIGGTSRRGFAPKVSGMGRSYDDVVTLLVESGMGITPTAVLPGYSVIATAEPDLFDTPQFDTFYGDAGRAAAAGLARMFGPGAGLTATANGQLLRDLVAGDALMVSGTDSPFVPYGAGLHAELRLYVRAGLTPREALVSSTSKAAIAAGVEHDLGRLAAGMVADLVIVDGDPLANIADADNVTMTVKNGRAYRLEELLKTP